jgi:hypothetical protein
MLQSAKVWHWVNASLDGLDRLEAEMPVAHDGSSSERESASAVCRCGYVLTSPLEAEVEVEEPGGGVVAGGEAARAAFRGPGRTRGIDTPPRRAQVAQLAARSSACFSTVSAAFSALSGG